MKAQIQQDLITAMKSRLEMDLSVLRSVKTAITNAEKANKDQELTNIEIINIVRKLINQRNDSIDQFVNAKRFDLADKERSEKAILEKYLPQQLSQDELNTLVNGVIAELGASSKKDMGNVIKAVQAKTEGRADNKLISRLVAFKLTAIENA
jgi:uncharacterized protein YqeY